MYTINIKAVKIEVKDFILNLYDSFSTIFNAMDQETNFKKRKFNEFTYDFRCKYIGVLFIYENINESIQEVAI